MATRTGANLIKVVGAGILSACVLRETVAERPIFEPPAQVTLDQRVEAADFIFIGEARRVFFVDRRYREVPYEKAAQVNKVKAAMLEVQVLKPLFPQPWPGEVTALIPLTAWKGSQPGERGSYDELVDQHVGKRGIYFTSRTEIYYELPTGDGVSNRLESRLFAHTRSTPAAQAGPKENPLALTYLEGVTTSVRKRLERTRK